MIAMIFEFWFDPNSPEIFEEYLKESTELRSMLAGVDGFHGVERFQSCKDADKFVAIGFFDDEEAVSQWRNRAEHRRVQALGRRKLFVNYRLRMCEVVRDYGARARDQVPTDSRRVHG